MNKDAILEKILHRYRVEEDEFMRAEWWKQREEKYGISAVQSLLFLDQLWRGHIAYRGLLEIFKDLKMCMHDDDSMEKKSFRENLGEIQALIENPGTKGALESLISSVQTEAIFGLLDLLLSSGTTDYGVSTKWDFVVDGDEGPKSAADLMDLLWKFHPENLK